jgi:predicted negative regulator of RcsB-dependent stress response
VDSYRTEEEQIEAIKRWWKENGTSTLTSIVLAVAVIFGWQAWQKNKSQKAEAAAAVYQEMLLAEQQVEANAVNLANVHHLAGKLKTDFAATTYAQYAALLLAKHAVETNDLDVAEAELRWVLEQKPGSELEQLTRLRLARVVFAQDRDEEALVMIREADAGSFAPAYEELAGDIQLQAGNLDQALASYKRSRELTEQSGQSPHPFLLMKLVDLEGGSVKAPAEQGQSNEAAEQDGEEG